MEIIRVPLIHALTRQPTVLGITYNYFALMLVTCAVTTIATKWYVFSLFFAAGLYVMGRWLTATDPQWLDGFILQNKNCRLQKNKNYWGCRSYAPW